MARMLTKALQLLVLSRENLDLTLTLTNCSVGKAGRWGHGGASRAKLEYELRSEFGMQREWGHR